MCGGEYNNLGHYMVRRDDGKEFEVLDIPTLDDTKIGNENFEICRDYKEEILHPIQCGFTIECDVLKTLFGISNNWRKMHGIPMYRKMR